MRIRLYDFGTLARMLFEVAAILELRAHITRHCAIAFALSQPAWLASLFGSLALVVGWAVAVAVVQAVLVGGCVVHHDVATWASYSSRDKCILMGTMQVSALLLFDSIMF